jgi:hypothetical protein
MKDQDCSTIFVFIPKFISAGEGEVGLIVFPAPPAVRDAWFEAVNGPPLKE